MSITHRGSASRLIAGRHFPKISVALAVALTGAAIAASGASAATPCVDRTFGPTNTYQPCVRDEQILLNDLWYDRDPGPNQPLTVDGYYGPHTASDVLAFNSHWEVFNAGSTTIPTTWRLLCGEDNFWGFHGIYWHDAGC